MASVPGTYSAQISSNRDVRITARTSPDPQKKAVQIDTASTESPMTGGGTIITGEQVAKLWEESRKPAKQILRRMPLNNRVRSGLRNAT